MTTKREWVLQAFKNESVDKVPVGFWYHFTTDEERGDGFNPEIFNKNIAGHKKFIADVNPDFVKIMSDGFFTYPKVSHQSVKIIHGLKSKLSSLKKSVTIFLKILPLFIIFLPPRLISNGISQEKVVMVIRLSKILSKKMLS